MGFLDSLSALGGATGTGYADEQALQQKLALEKIQALTGQETGHAQAGEAGAQAEDIKAQAAQRAQALHLLTMPLSQNPDDQLEFKDEAGRSHKLPFTQVGLDLYNKILTSAGALHGRELGATAAGQSRLSLALLGQRFREEHPELNPGTTTTMRSLVGRASPEEREFKLKAGMIGKPNELSVIRYEMSPTNEKGEHIDPQTGHVIPDPYTQNFSRIRAALSPKARAWLDSGGASGFTNEDNQDNTDDNGLDNVPAP